MSAGCDQQECHNLVSMIILLNFEKCSELVTISIAKVTLESLMSVCLKSEIMNSHRSVDHLPISRSIKSMNENVKS